MYFHIYPVTEEVAPIVSINFSTKSSAAVRFSIVKSCYFRIRVGTRLKLNRYCCMYFKISLFVWFIEISIIERRIKFRSYLQPPVPLLWRIDIVTVEHRMLLIIGVVGDIEGGAATAQHGLV